jgi:hypothetical protein
MKRSSVGVVGGALCILVKQGRAVLTELAVS